MVFSATRLLVVEAVDANVRLFDFHRALVEWMHLNLRTVSHNEDTFLCYFLTRKDISDYEI